MTTIRYTLRSLNLMAIGYTPERIATIVARAESEIRAAYPDADVHVDTLHDAVGADPISITTDTITTDGNENEIRARVVAILGRILDTV